MTQPRQNTGGTPRRPTTSARWLQETPATSISRPSGAEGQLTAWPDRARHLTPASGFRDLTYAAALAAASERMHACQDAAALLQVVAVEAAALLPADGTAIMAGSGDDWRPLSTPGTHLEPDLDHGPVWAVAVARAGLLDPGYLPDLDGVIRSDTRLTDIDKPPGWPPWRSLLVIDLPCPGTDHLRLLWYSYRVAAFHNHLDVAALFVRHTAVSLRVAIQRDQLNPGHGASAIRCSG